MIEVESLSKAFASGVLALDRVSFVARPGGVLGFLGPNGAGKTTTMRILSGYLRPSAGRATVCGFDVVLDSLAARRRLGYLPEQVPLYGEMRVSEYLRFRADLRGLSGRRRLAAIGAAVEEVGLAGHSASIIGQLSKGYRQRVGLADALLHRPDVLILDEPTDGLDPNQRREVLDLITALGRERTVVLSTHVLPEIERVCERVVVIDQGRIVAQGTTAELLAGTVSTGRIEVDCRGPRQEMLTALRAVAQVIAVEEAADGSATPQGEPRATAAAAAAPQEVLRLVVRLDPQAGAAQAAAACEALARAVVMSRGELRRLAPARSDLEAVFRWLTTQRGTPGGDTASSAQRPPPTPALTKPDAAGRPPLRAS